MILGGTGEEAAFQSSPNWQIHEVAGHIERHGRNRVGSTMTSGHTQTQEQTKTRDESEYHNLLARTRMK